MKLKLKRFLKNYFEHKALVLMYHRVATPDVDVWDLAVTPANFEQQMQLLRTSGKVVPLDELVEKVRKKQLKRKSIAITFDDGYADNYLVAKPLLEKYQLPATFFITSINLGKTDEFWWDELEQLILLSEELPQMGLLEIAGAPVKIDLKDETYLRDELRLKHVKWNAVEDQPETERSKLFLQLWQLLRNLPNNELQVQLQKIRAWAGVPKSTRAAYQSMKVEQLQEMARNPLFQIGAHTVSHISLDCHNAERQKQEISENRSFLQQATGQAVNILSYPYGNYNSDTLALATELDFEAAFTTEEKAITRQSSAYQLGRFQVKNLAALDFKHTISYWESNC